MTNVSRIIKLIKSWWRPLIICLTPIILLPIPLVIQTIQARCAYIVLLLTVYWVSEAIPYAVTSLLPLAFFPLAGILTGDVVGLNYFKDITTMFVGIMILAYAMEHVGLHRRLALLVLRYVGSSIIWSMAGLMVVTAFLSMWINNSAAANIMIPTAIAIVDELQKHEQSTKTTILTTGNDNYLSETDDTIESTSNLNEQATGNSFLLDKIVVVLNSSSSGTTSHSNQTKNQVNYEQVKIGFLIAVAFSAAIGGMMTLVGTGPNIFVKGFTDQYYSSGGIIFQISFANFLLWGLPIGIVMLVLCWLWLQIVYNRRGLFRCKRSNINETESRKDLKSLLKQQYKDLGPVSWQEGTVSVLFIVVVLLWITRDFSSVRGWDALFRPNYVTDGTTAILIGCIPLIFPNRNPFHNDWEYHPILTWDLLSKSFPWGVFMLQGAGLAIAQAFQVSDLSSTIAAFLHFIVGAPQTAIIFIVIVISAIFTEFTSNLACATILFPILDSIARTANMHPAYLILPCCMAVSLSFMLPIATPPNAMIFASGNMKTRDLIKAGIGAKIIGIIVIFFASTVLLSPIFHIHALTNLPNSTLMGNITTG
ncbi:unnamed protein product [Adineta steineri]|uniref:Uncharacterized protein n=1 Tax=Adineta steineri TaxID=433720 RepID=A0A814WUF6_9BILA|nr:unnamed protein product [Adineta steineri]CAF1409171.1 unnamed protein product [Adineta steineri]CAF3837674.1 unnamed protein product [Adineta steineri]CAF4015768.1 unnamed protein product [Adineta steineri]